MHTKSKRTPLFIALLGALISAASTPAALAQDARTEPKDAQTATTSAAAADAESEAKSEEAKSEEAKSDETSELDTVVVTASRLVRAGGALTDFCNAPAGVETYVNHDLIAFHGGSPLVKQ